MNTHHDLARYNAARHIATIGHDIHTSDAYRAALEAIVTNAFLAGYSNGVTNERDQVAMHTKSDRRARERTNHMLVRVNDGMFSYPLPPVAERTAVHAAIRAIIKDNGIDTDDETAPDAWEVTLNGNGKIVDIDYIMIPDFADEEPADDAQETQTIDATITDDVTTARNQWLTHIFNVGYTP